MENIELKEMIKEILKESGSISINISKYGDIGISLEIDGELIMESNYVDIPADCQDVKDRNEARARC